MGDPRNPRGAPSAFGPRAELRMPSFHDAELWQPRAGVPAGAISVIISAVRCIHPRVVSRSIRLPAIRRTPAMLASSFTTAAITCVSAARPISWITCWPRARSRPRVAVFVAPSSEHGRVADYDLNDRYAALICDELLPWLAERVQLHEDPRTRAIIGASFGGLIALYIAYGRPDRFGLVGSQSAYVGRDGDAIVRLFRGTERLPLQAAPDRRHLRDRSRLARSRRGRGRFRARNRLLRDVLMARGYPLRYAEYHDGHAWGFWRARLGDALRFLLG